MTSPNDMFAMADSASDEELAKAIRDPMSSSISQIAALDTLMKRNKLRNAAMAEHPKSTETVSQAKMRELGFAQGGLIPTYGKGGKVKEERAPSTPQPWQRSGGGKKGGNKGPAAQPAQPAYDPRMYDPAFKDTVGWIGGTPPPPPVETRPGKSGFLGGLFSGTGPVGPNPMSIAKDIVDNREERKRARRGDYDDDDVSIMPVAPNPIPNPNPSSLITQPAQQSTQLAPTPVTMPTPVTSQPITQGPQPYNTSNQTASTMANNPFGSTMQPLAQPPKSFSYADGGVVNFKKGGDTGPTEAEIREYVIAAAMDRGIDPAIALSLVRKESSFNPRAKGPLIEKFKGTEDQHAIGLTQLLPSTARSVGVKDINDWMQNVDGGMTYYAKMRKKFGTDYDALRAYNAGPGNANKYASIAHDYASSILQRAGRGYTPGDDAGLGSEQYATLKQALGDMVVPEIKPKAPPPVDASRRGLMKDYADMLMSPQGSEDPEADMLQEAADRSMQQRRAEFEKTRPEFARFAQGGVVKFDEGSLVLPLNRRIDRELEELVRRRNPGYEPLRSAGDNFVTPGAYIPPMWDMPAPAPVPEAKPPSKERSRSVNNWQNEDGSDSYMPKIEPSINVPELISDYLTRGSTPGYGAARGAAMRAEMEKNKGPGMFSSVGTLRENSEWFDKEAADWWKDAPSAPFVRNPKKSKFDNDAEERFARNLSNLKSAGSGIMSAGLSAAGSTLGALADSGDYLFTPEGELVATPGKKASPDGSFTPRGFTGTYDGARSAGAMFNAGLGLPATSGGSLLGGMSEFNAPKASVDPYKPEDPASPDIKTQNESVRDTVTSAERGAGRGFEGGELEKYVRGMRPDSSAKEARLAAREEENRRLALLQAGLGIAAGKSRYFAQNLAGAMPAIEGYQRGLAAIDNERDEIESREDAYNNALVAARSGDLRMAQQYGLTKMELDARAQEKRDAMELELKKIGNKHGISPNTLMNYISGRMKSDEMGNKPLPAEVIAELRIFMSAFGMPVDISHNPNEGAQ